MGSNITSDEYRNNVHINSETLATYAGALAIIMSVLTMLVKMLLRPQVVVNCWFCNTNFKVPSKDSNGWYCSNCEQYNGFLADGDYNKDILEQRTVNPKNNYSYAAKSKFSTETNGLCSKCNANQEMKILHLASFEALVPSNYDEELKIYQKQLESAYRLCPKCENTVAATLEHKKGLVLGLKLKQSEKRTFKGYKFLKYKEFVHKALICTVAILCLLAATVSPFLEYLDILILNVLQAEVQGNFSTLLIGNILAELVLAFCSGRKLPFLLGLTHLTLYFLLEDQYVSRDTFSYLSSSLSTLTFIITILTSSKSKQSKKSAFVKMQKIKRSPLRRSETEPKAATSQSTKTATDVPSANPLIEEEKPLPTLKTDSHQMSTLSLEPLKPPPTELLPQTTSQYQDDNSSVDSAFSNNDSVTQDNDSEKSDVNSLIQTLNLGSQWSRRPVTERPRTPKRQTPEPRHEFQSRMYGQTDRPLLSPSRLGSTSPKTLNESSWVAGGFWQKQDDPSSSHNLTSCRPSSPNPSVYSHNSSWTYASAPSSPSTNSFSAFEPFRPGTPTHFPMHLQPSPYTPPNGFHQPFGFQPFIYPAGMTPLWNPSMFQPISPNQTASSASCSSESTCSSVRRKTEQEWEASEMGTNFGSASMTTKKCSNFLETLWSNSSVILYTSVFYIALTGSVIFFYTKL